MNYTHTIPRYNWPLTEQYFKSLDYLEGRDYAIKHSRDTVTLTFTLKFVYERYWDQWGKHIVSQ